MPTAQLFLSDHFTALKIAYFSGVKPIHPLCRI
jgi:hypothetical protein